MATLVPFIAPGELPFTATATGATAGQHQLERLVRPDIAALRQLIQKFKTWDENKLFQALQNFYANQDDVFYSAFAARDSTITDIGIKVGCKLFQNSLKMLDLSGCKNITREGIREISGLVNLRVLNLTNCHLTPEDLKCLKGISSLKSLKLAHIDTITDHIVELLSTLDGLEDLDLTKTKVTINGIASISESPVSKSLRKLYISGAPAAIVAKRSLVEYSTSSSITDILCKFANLTELFIGNLSTKNEVQAIKAAISLLGVTVTISSNGIIEISRSASSFSEPLANRVEAPAELVTLLESIKASPKASPDRFKPPVPYPLDYQSYESPMKSQVYSTKLRHEAIQSPRRSPRLASKKSSVSTPQSIASPLRISKATSKVESPVSMKTSLTPTPKSNLKKRARSSFEDIDTPESASKRARRVSFFGISRSPTQLSVEPTEQSSSSSTLMEVDSEGGQPTQLEPQPLLAPPTGQGLFGFLKDMFF